MVFYMDAITYAYPKLDAVTGISYPDSKRNPSYQAAGKIYGDSGVWHKCMAGKRVNPNALSEIGLRVIH